MSEPYLGRIQCFGFNWLPRGWASFDGALLSVSQYSALFALLGTTYGGNGSTTFALSDLRGRFALCEGNGPGLSQYVIGEKGGAETNTLTVQQLAAHTHVAALNASSVKANNTDPLARSLGVSDKDTYVDSKSNEAMNSTSVTHQNTGGNAPINNMPPYLTINWCIALGGIFPSR